MEGENGNKGVGLKFLGQPEGQKKKRWVRPVLRFTVLSWMVLIKMKVQLRSLLALCFLLYPHPFLPCAGPASFYQEEA